MAYDTKTVALTGQRVGELERVKDLLSGMDIDYGGSNQQALSAAMQVFIAYVERGGDVGFEWYDGRQNNRVLRNG